MRYLLDECLSDLVARTMDVLADGKHHYAHLLRVAPQQTQDEEIPQVCKDAGFGCLITVNVKDFGARKAIFEEVLAAGVHCLVLRVSRGERPDDYWLVSRLALHLRRYSKVLAEVGSPTLVVVNMSGVRQTTLADLLAEIQATESGRPPLP